MQIVLFRGVSLFPSRAIRWFTRSPYSHAAFRFDAAAEKVARELKNLGRLRLFYEHNIVEAWQGGVKNVYSMSTLHTPRTPVDIFDFYPALSPLEERQLILALAPLVGRPYSYWDIIAFVLRLRGESIKRGLFCSQTVALAAEQAGRPLFLRTKPYEVPPGWIQRSLGLRLRCSSNT